MQRLLRYGRCNSFLFVVLASLAVLTTIPTNILNAEETKDKKQKRLDTPSFLKQACNAQDKLVLDDLPQRRVLNERAPKLKTELAIEVLDQYAELDKSLLFFGWNLKPKSIASDLQQFKP